MISVSDAYIGGEFKFQSTVYDVAHCQEASLDVAKLAHLGIRFEPSVGVHSLQILVWIRESRKKVSSEPTVLDSFKMVLAFNPAEDMLEPPQVSTSPTAFFA